MITEVPNAVCLFIDNEVVGLLLLLLLFNVLVFTGIAIGLTSKASDGLRSIRKAIKNQKNGVKRRKCM